jgi:hypothetical protein
MNATTVTRSSASLVGVDVAKSVFQPAGPRVCQSLVLNQQLPIVVCPLGFVRFSPGRFGWLTPKKQAPEGAC